MADQINPPAPTQNEPPANPHLEGVEANVAPNMDSELDSALNAVFKNQPINEEKPAETPKEDKKQQQPEKPEPKEDKQTDKSKKPVQGELQEREKVVETPKNQQAWTALKNSNKEAHKIIQEREEEIRKLKSGLAEKGSLSTKEIEDLKKEVTELSKYRTMVDIQADPEFVSKYDQPISKIQTSIKDLLGSLNVKPEVVDQIDFTDTKLMDQIIGHVGEHRDKITARKLERKIEEMIGLVDQRAETLNEQKSAYKDFIENKKKESSIKGAESEGRTFRHIEAIASAKDKEGRQMFPFLNKITPEDGSTQAQIDQANSHNRLVEVMAQKINGALKLSSPEERAELAVAAVASHYLSAQLRAAAGKIKSLEDELKKISTVSSSSAISKTKPATSNSGPREMDLDSALSQHFSR